MRIIGHRLPQQRPKCFCRLQLRGIRRQWKNPNVFGYLHFLSRMKSGPVNQENDVFLPFWINEGGKFFQSQVHENGVDGGQKQPEASSGNGVDESIGIDPLVLPVLAGDRTLSFGKPYLSDDRLQTESRFVFRPDLYFFVREFFFDRFDGFLKFFLKAVCSSAVAALVCVGRGICRVQEIFFSHSQAPWGVMDVPVSCSIH